MDLRTGVCAGHRPALPGPQARCQRSLGLLHLPLAARKGGHGLSLHPACAPHVMWPCRCFPLLVSSPALGFAEPTECAGSDRVLVSDRGLRRPGLILLFWKMAQLL